MFVRLPSSVKRLVLCHLAYVYLHCNQKMRAEKKLSVFVVIVYYCIFSAGFIFFIPSSLQLSAFPRIHKLINSERSSYTQEVISVSTLQHSKFTVLSHRNPRGVFEFRAFRLPSPIVLSSLILSFSGFLPDLTIYGLQVEPQLSSGWGTRIMMKSIRI